MSRVLKGRYFPNHDLSYVQFKGKDSWLWKSWMAARNVVASGMLWKARNGKSVNIWEDSSVPNETGGRVISAKPISCTVNTVAELIDHQRKCWNYTLVRQMFQPLEAMRILQMPVYKGEYKDKSIWRAEKSGVFTVRSAYKLACTIRREGMAKAESSKTMEDKGRM